MGWMRCCDALDKYRPDPARDARMLEFCWLLEELRVSFFAQELRTPQPVSIKRLEKAWGS